VSTALPSPAGETDEALASDAGSRRRRSPALAVMLIAAMVLSGFISASPLSPGSTVPTPAYAAGKLSSTTPTLGGTFRVGTRVLAHAGTWGPAPVSLKYRWFVGGELVEETSTYAYTIRPEDLGKDLHVEVLGTKPGYDPLTRSSAAHPVQAGVIYAPQLGIVGEVRAGRKVELITSSGSWSPASVGLTYEWLYDGQPLSDSDATTHFIPADRVGAALAVRITASRAGYEGKTFTVNAGVVGPDVITAPQLTLRGETVVGRELRVERFGEWAPAPVNENYEWYYDGQKVGSDSPTHVIQPEGAGKTVSVRVIGSKLGYDWHTVTISAGTAVPAPLEPFVTAPAPTLLGQVKVGSKVTAFISGWNPEPTGLAYQWLRGGALIRGATLGSYVPTAADAGKQLSVEVTATRPGYRQTVRVSAAQTVGALSSVVPKRFSSTPRPGITGAARAGKKLTVRPGAWQPARVTLRYQWLRNGKAISGARKTSYRLTAKDRGKRISVRVTGTKPGYHTVSKVSSAKRVSRAR